jgi:hypothetical protein
MKPQVHSRWDTGSVIRLLAVLGSLGVYLSITQWAEHLEWAFVLILVGGLIGAFVGTSRFNFWESSGIAFVLGTTLTFLSGASTLSLQANLLTTEYNYFYILTQGFIELTHHQPVSSSFLFLAAVMTTCWYLGYFCGFMLIRKSQPWIPIGLAGIAVVIIDLFLTATRRNGTISAIFFFFGMILISRIFFSRSKESWQRKGIHFDQEARFDFNRLVVFASLIIVVAAWIIPTAIKAFTPGTVEQLKFHAYMEKIAQQWDNLFAPLNQSSNLTVFSYEDLLTIGNSTPSSEKTLFSVQTSTPAPTGTHYYWRARSYDSYDGTSWFNSAISQDAYFAGSDLSPILNSKNSVLQKFIFRTNVRIGIFFQGGIPGSVNQAGMVVFNPIEGGGKDIVAVLPGRIIENGSLYSTNGWVSSPTVADMERSSTSYPTWVSDRYLSISPTVPKRVKELAASITASATDPYSKTEAITMYLRLNMHYSNIIQVLPEGKDLVDYFLFDSKEGFCSQYASAEVIMLRSLGIPARLVAGYAQGAESQSGRQYIVRLKDSHAWPEIYFTDIGWVAFEPTVIIAQQVFPTGIIAAEQSTPTVKATLVVTPQSEAPAPTANQSNPVEVVSGTSSGSFTWFFLFAMTLLIVGAGSITYFVIRRNRKNEIRSIPALLNDMIISSGGTTPEWIKNWEKSLQMRPIEKQFRVVKIGLNKLHQTIRSSETPQEQVSRLIELIPGITPHAEFLLKEYEKSIYGGQCADLKMSEKATWEIRKLIFYEQINRILHRPESNKTSKN